MIERSKLAAALPAVTFVALSGLAAIAGVGCGGAKPPEAESPETETEPEGASSSGRARRGNPGMQMSTELGLIDAKAVQATFDRLHGKLDGCYKTGLSRVDYLAGDVKIFLRVGQDGAVRYGYLEDSTIGDADTEKCLMGVLTNATWPKPEGGEAEVRNGFGFDGPGDVRPPVAWNADRVAAELGKNDAKFQQCKGSVKGSFHATVYVEPDGKQGKVQALGVVPPSKEGLDKVDCLVDAVRSMAFPSPGSYAAKVSFVL